MGFSCGIIGLPNVGKSTLFNALSQTALAQAMNYPFCTIEPNVSRIEVPDERLDLIAALNSSALKINARIDLFDIAGLVRGASSGAGLGNKFLSHIRQVEALLHVVRCFDSEEIVHVEGSADPLRDIELIETELMLADIESITQRLKKNRVESEVALLKQCLAILEAGQMLNRSNAVDCNATDVKHLQLLTSKPQLYVCNVLEQEIGSNNAYVERVMQLQPSAIVVSARLEAELCELSDPTERAALLREFGLAESGLALLVRAGYSMLDLISFFTAGPQEARAWTIKKGALAPQAAGVIHTDFEEGFIKADIISFADYIAYKGEQGCKDAGKMRLEGREYQMADGDVAHFRFNRPTGKSTC